MGKIRKKVGSQQRIASGQYVEITAVNPDGTVNVRFLTTGSVKNNVPFCAFTFGRVKDPLYEKNPRFLYLGAVKRMLNGKKAIITELIGAEVDGNIRVAIEDGRVLTCTLREFLDGKTGVASSNHRHSSSLPVLPKIPNEYNRIGEKFRQTNGLFAELVTYRSAGDIDIRFSDGTIRAHVRYDNFVNGLVSTNVPIKPSRRKAPEKFLGRTVRQRNGLMACVVGYRHTKDIDVEFEDGTIVKNVQMSTFLSGRVGNPGVQCRNEYPVITVGATNIMRNGQKATIIDDAHGFVDVAFEDGTIVKHKTKNNFRIGNIGNPNYRITSVSMQ